MPPWRIYIFEVDGRTDNIYAFGKSEDRDAFARAVREEGGDGVTHDVLLLGTSQARFLIEAERDSSQ